MYRPTNFYRVLLLSLTTALLLAAVIPVLCRVVRLTIYYASRPDEFHEKLDDIRAKLHHYLEKLRPSEGVESPDIATKRRIVERKLERRLEMLRLFMVVSGGMAILSISIHTLDGRVRVWSPQEDMCLLVTTFLLLYRKKLMSARCPEWLWHSTLMLATCCWILSGLWQSQSNGQLQELQIHMTVWATLFIRITLSTKGCVRLDIFWNTVYYLVIVVFVIFKAQARTEYCDLMAVEAQIAFFACGLSWVSRSTAWSEAEQSMSMRHLEGQNYALDRLLIMLCDVVFVLSDELHFTEESPCLLAMLMLEPSRTLKGTSFLDLMKSDSDREAICREVANGSMEVGHSFAGITPVVMRDNLGNDLKVEIFYVSIVGIDDKQNFVVGLREYVDQPFSSGKRPFGKKGQRHSVSSDGSDSFLTPLQSQSTRLASPMTCSMPSSAVFSESSEYPANSYFPFPRELRSPPGSPPREAEESELESELESPDLVENHFSRIDFYALAPFTVTYMNTKFSEKYADVELGTSFQEWIGGNGTGFLSWVKECADGIFDDLRSPQVAEFGYVYIPTDRVRATRHAGTRHLTVNFPAKEEGLDRADYVVSLKIGKRKKGSTLPSNSTHRPGTDPISHPQNLVALGDKPPEESPEEGDVGVSQDRRARGIHRVCASEGTISL